MNFQVKRWSGSVDSVEGLQSALAARSYQGEIILSVFVGWHELLVQVGALQHDTFCLLLLTSYRQAPAKPSVDQQ